MASFVSGGGGGSNGVFIIQESTTFTELKNAIESNKTLIFDNYSFENQYMDGGQQFYYVIAAEADDSYAAITVYGGGRGAEYFISSTNVWEKSDWDTAPLVSPAFTGRPTAPTAASGTNTTQIATTAFVQNAISSDVFVATYGTTTQTELTAAITANKRIYVTGFGGDLNTKYFVCEIGRSDYDYVLTTFEGSYNTDQVDFLIFICQGDSSWINVRQSLPNWESVNTAISRAVITPTTSIVYVNGAVASITYMDGTVKTFSNLYHSFIESSSVYFIQVTQGSSLDSSSVRFYELKNVSTIDQSVILRCIEGTTIHTVEVQDTGNGLIGTYSTSIIASDKVSKAGDTMTGALTLSGAPTANLHAVTKKYVDDAVSGIDLSAYMVKGTDYVTAGQKSGTTLGEKATAEGDNTTASGINSHAEGSGTKATAAYAHAEGVGTTASNSGAHAEGMNTTASGMYAHAEGWTNTASAQGAHAEGMNTYATNQAAHAEGNSNTASGYYSHAEGYGTTAQRRSQHVFGELNVLDTGGSGTTVKGTYVEIVGNGTANNARSNARTLDWSGNETLAGKLTVGADPVNNMDVATKQYVDNSKEIFIAVYGTTTYAEINAAYNAGKHIIVSRDFNGTTLYVLTNVGTSGTYHFRTFGSSANISYGCYIGTDGVWHVNSNTFASQSALETGLAEKQKIITVSTEEPTSADGVNGDIWFVYEE